MSNGFLSASTDTMTTTYSADNFSSLPSLREARVSFTQANARVFLDGPIHDLFVGSNMQTKFGVALLHRHFDIKPNQRLVDYHKTATAWTTEDTTTTTFPKYDGVVVPRAYLFDASGVARPYEFEFITTPETSPVSDIVDAKEPDFINAFYALLRKLDLEKIFGLRNLNGYDPALSVEVTEGTANIMLPPSAIPSDSLVEAMWTFDDVTTAKCHCREYCFSVNDEHEANHGCS